MNESGYIRKKGDFFCNYCYHDAMKQISRGKNNFLGKGLGVGWMVLWIVVGVVGLLAIVLTWRYIALSDDGTRDLGSAQKAFAQKAIDAQYATYLNPNIGNFLKNYFIHVDSVFPTSAEDLEKYCSQRNAKGIDPASPQYYSAEISVHRLFGGEIERKTYDGCFLMDKEIDGRDLSR